MNKWFSCICVARTKNPNAVEAADTGAGTEISQPVSAALPEVVVAVMAELRPAKTAGPAD